MLSVIIPAHNCRAAVPAFVRRWSEVVSARTDIEVLVTDNASSDGTPDCIEREAALLHEKNIRVLRIPHTMQHGQLLLAGMKHASGDLMSFTASLQDSYPGELTPLYETWRLNNEISLFVKCRRTGLSIPRRMEEIFLGMLSQRLLGYRMHDVYCCPKLFSRVFYNKYLRKGAPQDETFDLHAVYCAAKNGRIIENDRDLHRDRQGKATEEFKAHESAKALGKAMASLREKLIPEDKPE
ncbi:MAG: glycosyltransferase [Bacteroidota bacterium]